jgi:hypothetical protein
MAKKLDDATLDKLEDQLLIRLFEDVDRCHEFFDESLVDPKDLDVDSYLEFEFRARLLFRAVFALFEGVTFNLKLRAADWCIDLGKQVSEGEKAFVLEWDYALSNNGTVIRQKAKARLLDAMRLMFVLMERVHDLPPFDANVEWWSCLKSSIKVRDRLTHPKLVFDLDVSGNEVKALLKAYYGFYSHLISYPPFKVAKKRKGKAVKRANTNHKKSTGTPQPLKPRAGKRRRS